SRVECVYFLMSDENVRRGIQLPWVSFGSDAAALSPSGDFLKSNPHPRAYGCFARVLGRYVRDENAMPIEVAVHKLTGLPARNLGLRSRGLLKKDYFADCVVFDPATIADLATYEAPHQLARGVREVLVNGTLVVRDGKPPGAKPGRVVHGPGKGRFTKRPPVEVTPSAEAVHAASFAWDGHNDLPWQIRSNASSSFERLDVSQPQSDLHTDIP